MTKKDWKYFWASMAVSVFVGTTVLAVILFKNNRNKKKLSVKELKKLVEDDLDFWNGTKENSTKGSTRIAEYWKLIDLDFTPAQVASSSHRKTWYWSAIYISDLMDRWGAGDRFKSSSRHAVYIVEGKKARAAKDTDAIFYSYKPSEIKVEVGDLVGKTRKSGINLDNITTTSPTHTDLVYKIEKNGDGYIAYAVGGNVSDSVNTTKYYLDEDQKMKSPSQYLVVMKNQKL